MPRCALPAALAAAVALSIPFTAAAQLQRPFPRDALRGEINFVAPPDVLLNGKPARLSPGARIVDAQNLLQLSGALVGQRLVVNYTRDAAGQPHQVWILTAAERAKQPWPATDEQARTWFFDPAAQVWSRP